MTRRDTLRAGAGVVAAATGVGTAGCTGRVTDLIDRGGNAEAAWAPADSQAVLVVDVQSILDDEATRKLANAYLETAAESEHYDGPETYEEALQTAEDESNLPPTDLRGATAFGNYDAIRGEDEPYGGVVFEAEWTEDDIVNALEAEGPEFVASDYKGTTVYENESEYSDLTLGVLGNNRYAFGTRAAVEDAVDVNGGDEDSITAELSSAFDATRNGSAVRFAAEVPEETVPRKIPTRNGDSIELDAYRDVPHVAGAIYSTGDAVGVELLMLAEDEATAEEVKEQTEALITFAKSLESTTDETEAFLDNIEVARRNTTTVALTYEQPVDDLADRIEAITEQRLGDQVQSEVPHASFTFDYEATSNPGTDAPLVDDTTPDTGEVTVTHDGGDEIPRTQLAFHDTDGNRLAPAPFPEADVTAGDSATVAVESDDTLRVVWTAEGGGASAVLAKWVGPDG